MKSFRFVSFIHFLLDFLNVFKRVSLFFQREDLLLSLVRITIDKALSELERLKTTPGPMENLFVNSTSLNGIFQEIQLEGIQNSLLLIDKGKLLNAGIKYLQQRFSEDHDRLAAATSVFDTFSWPSGEDLMSFGEKEIEVLGRHFSAQLTCSNRITEQEIQCLKNEWYEFKVLGKGLKLSELLDRVLYSNERFPLLSKLLSIVAVLPVSTASCERGFSTMNFVKNKYRTSMEIDSLNDLLMISLNGPPLAEFNPTQAVDRWFFKSKTPRHINGHKKPCKRSATAAFGNGN